MLLRVIQRRAVLRALAAAGLGAAVAPRTAAADTEQVWMCTFRDCVPYYYVPGKGDPDNINGAGPIPPGTRFEDLPDDWICPNCGAAKNTFIKVKGEGNPERAE